MAATTTTTARRTLGRRGVGCRLAMVSVALALTAGLAAGLAACGDDDDEPQPAGTEAEFSEYIGLETEAAGDLAEENDRPWRVVRQDGEDLPVTMDFVENRLNFAVEEGKVVEVTTG